MTIEKQLRERYTAPEWAIFFEVANGLGLSDRRYADAIAMSLFPSRGLDIHGFEVKRSRADWMRELKEPAKADSIARYCDFWWLVTSDEKVADKNEVPRTWGLLVSKDGELRQVKRAERMKGKAIDRPFMGAMLRRAHEQLTTALQNDERLVDAKEKGRQAGLAERDWKLKDDSEEVAKLKKVIKDFEDASGVAINRWDAGDIGKAVKAFRYSQKHDVTDDLTRAAGWMESAAKGLRERVDLLEKTRPKLPDPAPASIHSES